MSSSFFMAVAFRSLLRNFEFTKVFTATIEEGSGYA